jgi:hypothetical protein
MVNNLLQERARQAVRLLSDACSLVESVFPSLANAPNQFNFEGLLVFSMAWRCTSRAKAMALLLSDGFSDEAMIVLRSLAADSQRLAFTAIRPNRTALLLGHFRTRLINMENLAKQARESGQPGDHDDLIRRASKGRADLEALMKHRGLSKLAKFPAEGWPMAKALGRPDDVIDHVMPSMTVHGSLLGSGFNLATDQSGALPVSLRTDDPAMIVAVAGRGLEHLALAICSALEIALPSRIEELRVPMDGARARYRALELDVKRLRSPDKHPH